jgi:lysozyme
MSELVQMIKRHEGTGPMQNGRYLPYTDTVGKLTIGYGRNLTDTGLSQDEVDYNLLNDVAERQLALRKAYPWYTQLSYPRQDAMVDMAFNLGMSRLSQFKKMLAALADGDYQTAYDEALDSMWATQVGYRAKELATMLLTGQYQQ